MALIGGLSSRRRIPYSDIVRAEAPAARSDYYARLARERERDRLNAQKKLAERELSQSAKQFEDTLATNKEQFETGLAESRRQFGATSELQRQQMEEAEKQGQLATGISTAGLAVEAYPYIKEGAVSLSDLLFAESAAPTTAATTTASAETAAGGLTTASSGAEAGGGGLSGTGIAGIIAAAILGQHRLADLTETEFEGQRTGDFFTVDEQGRWAPRFGNEPWHGFMNQQWGAGPSAGEQWDAAVYNQDWGLAARRTPAMVQQWLNPVGDFGYDIAESRWGPELAGTLDPVTYGFDRIAEAEDIGDLIGKGGQASAKVMDPVGTLIGPSVENYVEDITGSTALGEVANVLLNPIGAAADFIDDISYLCTETEKLIGLGSKDRKYLNKLQRYAKDDKMAKHYYKNAPKLIKKINSTIRDLLSFYSEFYVKTIAPTVQFVKHNKYKEARDKYIGAYIELLKEYTPELLPEN